MRCKGEEDGQNYHPPQSNGTAPRRDMAYTCTNRHYLLPLLEVTQLQISSTIDYDPGKTNDSNSAEGHVHQSPATGHKRQQQSACRRDLSKDHNRL